MRTIIAGSREAFENDTLEQIRLQKIGKHAYVYLRNNGNKLNQVNGLIRV